MEISALLDLDPLYSFNSLLAAGTGRSTVGKVLHFTHLTSVVTILRPSGVFADRDARD